MLLRGDFLRLCYAAFFFDAADTLLIDSRHYFHLRYYAFTLLRLPHTFCCRHAVTLPHYFLRCRLPCHDFAFVSLIILPLRFRALRRHYFRRLSYAPLYGTQCTVTSIRFHAYAFAAAFMPRCQQTGYASCRCRYRPLLPVACCRLRVAPYAAADVCRR